MGYFGVAQGENARQCMMSQENAGREEKDSQCATDSAFSPIGRDKNPGEYRVASLGLPQGIRAVAGRGSAGHNEERTYPYESKQRRVSAT
ncbi:hypothetical protein HaLaN_09955 [Haematococcus lacustris]|uniref:Uncharacterized protein n=1 Tax=Haematococcus lacustris TaxID=44745 RepID=A0A699Z4Z2_HAELA|nr:hypothetical protein HaLaN_09955 [Haematococcus lacustris]